VDSRGEIREFLASRRARTAPVPVGVVELAFTAMDLPGQP
jgi:hypothetical protein